MTPPRAAEARKATGHRPGLHVFEDEGRERAIEVDRDQNPCLCRECGNRDTELCPRLSHCSPVCSDALSDALRLDLLARSTSSLSFSLARVGRCGFAGADASASR